MAIKFLASESTGTPLDAGETRSVVVTAEALAPALGYEGDIVEYSATIKNDLTAALPATFVVDLKIEGAVEIAGVILNVGNYDPVTFLFAINVTIPAVVTPGAKTINIAWAEQEI